MKLLLRFFSEMRTARKLSSFRSSPLGGYEGQIGEELNVY